MRAGKDVHLVTHTVMSLLGLVVFPWSRGDWEDGHKELRRKLEQTKLEDLKNDGWPEWDESLGGKSTTLDRLVNKIRNATTHGRITFSSDSRYLAEVIITLEDAWRGTPNWKAKIGGQDLYKFCLRFAEYLEKAISP